MFAILMATAPPPEDEDDDVAAGLELDPLLLEELEFPPQPAAARATRAQSRSRVLFM
jgi:hypothetical protein